MCPIVLYEYQPGCSEKHPEVFLEGFCGYLHTDGYARYHKLSAEITAVGCWDHVWRKFDEALKSIARGNASAKNIRKGFDFGNLMNYLIDGWLGKNFPFTNTSGGAQSSAAIFILLQTVIENALDPWRYLTWLIDAVTKGKVHVVDTE